MGEPNIIDQVLNLLSVLKNNTDLESLRPELLQRIIENPTEAGKHFLLFLANGGRMPIAGNFKIATALFDVSFVGTDWENLIEDQDERSAELSEVDFAKAQFISCLREGETSITGEEKLRRLKESKCVRFGANVFMGLWNDYLAVNKENSVSVLERAYRAGVIGRYTDFPGTVLRNPDGDRYILSLYRNDDGNWVWCTNWLESDWDASYVSAVSQQVA